MLQLAAPAPWTSLTRSGTHNCPSSDKISAESHTDLCSFFTALGRFLLCSMLQLGPALSCSQTLPQCGDRPQGFLLPLGQACSSHTLQGLGPRGEPLIPGQGGEDGAVWDRSKPPLSLLCFL